MTRTLLMVCGIAGAALAVAGCGPRGTGPDGTGRTTIRVEGSDTLVNLAQAWAENYHKAHPDVSIQVLGGGTGVGIASLTDGNCDMANASREMKPKEIARIKQKHGKEAREHVVGYDALAVYVHKDHPLDSLSLEELAEIYGEGGKTTRWSQLVPWKAGGSDEIVRVSRQNNSGTYVSFQEHVLGLSREFKLGSIDQSGSKDVVALVSRTPAAIGYSGMGYATDEVKMLKIADKKGEPGIEPSVENVRNKSYPLTRPLYVYTVEEPTGEAKKYLDWMLSDDGQKIVTELGYVQSR